MIQMGDTITPDSKNCFDLIVSHPSCNIYYQDADGNTALYYSSSVRNWWTLFRLIEHGACNGQQYGAASDGSKTSLQKFCCYLKGADIISFDWPDLTIDLLESVNINDRDVDGQTILHLLCMLHLDPLNSTMKAFLYEETTSVSVQVPYVAPPRFSRPLVYSSQDYEMTSLPGSIYVYQAPTVRRIDIPTPPNCINGSQ